MELSSQQREAVQKIKDWIGGSNRQVFRLFGYAGTGKTTVIATAVAEMNLKVAYVAYTGKAVSVMRNNGLPARTLHNLIYRFESQDIETQELRFSLNPTSEARRLDLIVLDECSMVGDKAASDLLRFNVKVLAIGDPAQLPPVKDEGYFVKGAPDALLTEVHRQALDSPVLRLATDTRNGKSLGLGAYGDSKVILGADVDEEDLWKADQVLVGKNATRRRLNERARSHFNMQGDSPQFGERVVCLKNDYAYGVMNGEIFNVMECEEINESWLKLHLFDTEMGREIRSVPVHKHFFGGPEASRTDMMNSNWFDFGYAMTVHKSQGSQWGHPLIVDESDVFREKKWNWLYTAITRASEKVTILRGKV
jgi:exodeoxyribonuclease-5